MSNINIRIEQVCNQESYSFILNTNDLEDDPTPHMSNADYTVTKYGNMNENRSVCTWQNIPLRKIVGSYTYERHEKFNLLFHSIRFIYTNKNPTSTLSAYSDLFYVYLIVILQNFIKII